MIDFRLTDARQFLAVAGWTVEETYENGRTVYIVRDSYNIPRRTFIPVDRLFDYARGVFDAQKL